jgi:hypothetical protein
VSGAPQRSALAALALLLLPVLASCRNGGQSSHDDAAFARYLEAVTRPIDPSARVDFGRGALPADFPGGLPLLKQAALLGWTRTSSRTSLSWQAVYTAAGDAGSVSGAIEDALATGGWQVHDRASSHGFNALDIVGVGNNDGRTGVISVGPSGAGVQVVEEIGQDRTAAPSASATSTPR